MRIKTPLKFWHNNQGNIAIMFALLSVLILTVVAVSVSTVQLHSQKSKLKSAADAAILAGMVVASDVLTEDNSTQKFDAVGVATAEESFALHIADIHGLSDVELDITYNFLRGRELRGNLTYKATGQTFLSSFIGRDKVIISDKVTAEKRLGFFARVNFLVDVSMSMGIGADMANQERLFEATGCAIACHYRLHEDAQDTLLAARSLDIRLRLDTVKDAIRQIIKSLQEKKDGPRQIEVAIYTFSNSLEEHLAPTINLSTALSSIDDIEITSSDNQGGTNLHHSLEVLSVLLPRSNDGRTRNRRRSYVIVLTDGVENSVTQARPGSSDLINQFVDPNFTIQQPSQFFPQHDNIQGLNTDSCESIKRQDHTLALINPVYLIPNTSNIKGHSRDKIDYIKTLLDDIPANSEACASTPRFFFSADTEADVEQASRDLFEEVFSQSVFLTE